MAEIVEQVLTNARIFTDDLKERTKHQSVHSEEYEDPAKTIIEEV